MNYLELVNRAIFESGVDLDQLDNTEFATPPRTVMYTRFKNWVNDSYREILGKAEANFLRSERTVAVIYPRVAVNTLSGTIAVGDELQGVDSGVRFIVTGTYTDPLNPAGTVELDYTYVDTPPMNFIMGERVRRLAPTPQDPIAYVQYLPGWDLKRLAAYIGDVDRSSMLVQDVTNGLQDSQPGMADYLFGMIWDEWLNYVTYSVDAASTPRYVSEGPDGKLYFWPRPDRPYSLMFTYSRTVGSMSTWSDTPWPIPSDLHLGIVWRAVRKYANFDAKPTVYLRSKAEGQYYDNKFEELYTPEVAFGPNLFWNYNDG